MRTSTVRLSNVTLDMDDAMELSELLDNLAQWPAQAHDSVRADLISFAWDEGAMPLVRERLTSFARLLAFGHARFATDDLYGDHPDDETDSDVDSGAGREGRW